MFLSKSHIKKILFIFLFVLAGTITLFTDIYLNLFKKTIQDILIKSTGLYNLQYEKIEGSFIEGFKIIDVTIDSEAYLLKSEEVSLNIDFLNILEGFKDIQFLGLENGKLILRNDSSDNISNSHYNQYRIESFQVNNFEIIYDNNVFLLESLNFDFDNGIFYDIDLKGSAKIPYYNANISNFEISFLNEESNKHSCQFKIDDLRLKNLYFERLDASGRLTGFFSFEGNFDLSGLSIFEKRFQDVYGDNMPGSQINVTFINSTKHIVAWHKHNIQTDYWTVLKGSLKVGLATKEDGCEFEYLSDKNPRVLEIKSSEGASGGSIRQVSELKEGISQENAKKVIADIKKLKLKIQIKIQGDELRVDGKKKDDLQEAIAAIKAIDIGLPIDFVNFRD